MGASRCFWRVHPKLAMPCLPPPQFPQDNGPIHLSLPLRGVRIPFPISAPQPCVGAASEALMRELIYCDLNIPCALLICLSTSIIHGIWVAFQQGKRVSISPSQGFPSHPSPCTIPLSGAAPYSPPSHIPFSLWGVIPIERGAGTAGRHPIPLPSHAPGAGQSHQGVSSLWKPWRARGGCSRIFQHSQAAFLLFQGCFPQEFTANLARGRAPWAWAERGCKWDRLL